jgi:cellulose synthase/poly-beta-1,6-N-acetylglucosamine synthase-like glycosyltransferase
LIRASVNVPAFNAQKVIARCLGALEAQTLPAIAYEILVGDDGSTDATRQIAASFHGARCISIPHAGAAARNRSAEQARGSILLFTDADCEPQPDWIETMLAAFDDPSIVGAKGTYHTRQRELAARFVQLEYEEKYARMRRAREIDFIDTYSAAYRREIFLANHGFDESFPTASEDQEFSFRLAEQGHKMIFVPDAIVYHQHAATLSAYLQRKFWIGYWKVRVHTHHPSKVLRDSHTPPTLKIQTALFPVLFASLAIPSVSFAWMSVGVWLCAFSVSALPLIIFIARRSCGLRR